MSEELARRAVACKHWRWLPGMLAERWTGPCHGTYRYSDHDVRAHRWWPGGLPVFNDPATVGCLLALVREAHGGAVVITEGNGWWSIETETTAKDDDDLPSFVHGLVWALEAAP